MTLKIALAVFVGVIALIVGFAFFIPHAAREAEKAVPSEQPLQTPLVTMTSSYAKGVHTISGSVLAPTPCTTLSAAATVASSTPEVISVAVLMPPDTGVCLQEETKLPFKLTVAAASDATIEVLVNGARASTTTTLP